ncbi:E3 ubiquitin-protein ligase MIEL1-like [Iris pallida]|uniref:E3 ubiquitin-protein ligase MIEL1-like n=1 Tax=Iris pallida TaxID=29817 RepID=A0AAX6IDW0_IRIPA|nr:E3 ubiquitin-protein ligase MIEL1-like [Iris pallida]
MEDESRSISEKNESLTDLGSGHFGCAHYRRRCRIRAPCCNEIFDCRHCHNEAKNSLDIDPLERHEIPRHDVKKVICSFCEKEQDVQQNCSSCGVCLGKYFCGKCNFFDDNVSKNQYHCDGCGICRTGGEENFFHCNVCGCCYSELLKDSHRCVERAMHHNCPICFEYLFESTKDISVLSCGHTIHLDCLKEMGLHLRFSCPICSKSVYDMSGVWKKLDQEVASTPMPEMYQNKMIWILCNDCGTESNIHFHIVAHKCPGCSSYNTRQTSGGPAACSRVSRELRREIQIQNFP